MALGSQVTIMTMLGAVRGPALIALVAAAGLQSPDRSSTPEPKINTGG